MKKRSYRNKSLHSAYESARRYRTSGTNLYALPPNFFIPLTNLFSISFSNISDSFSYILSSRAYRGVKLGVRRRDACLPNLPNLPNFYLIQGKNVVMQFLGCKPVFFNDFSATFFVAPMQLCSYFQLHKLKNVAKNVAAALR